jgi:3-oxoacyl-[acyl-carrier protein] reductase
MLFMHEKEKADGREVFRKVVNISSMAGTGGVAGQFAYSAAKAAVIGAARTQCKEWGRFKVNVNCVPFGLIETRLNAPRELGDTRATIEGREIELGLTQKFRQNTEALVPMGRIGTPEEAANGVYLFCIPEANDISGQVLVVSGGLTN